MRLLRKLVVVVLILAVLSGAAFYWLTIPRPLTAADLPEHTLDLANGETMFWAGGCGSCHAEEKAKGDDKKKLGGGLALITEFGTFRVPNISPDRETGIGEWSALEFVNAMKRGIGRNGSHLYPAFPYASYQRMYLGDLLDLKAYLETLPPVSKVSEPNDLKFPFNIRRGLGLWKLLYLDGKTFEPDSEQTEQVNRGRYLVEGPGHCAECHTSRDFAGGLNRMLNLAGAPAAEGDGFVPNITPSKDGIGDWSASDIAYSLESGFTPSYDSLGGSMTSVQENFSHVSAADRDAVAAYLKSIPPLPSPPR
ncbi:MAG: cytochrome c [Stappiaceae bacterium]